MSHCHGPDDAVIVTMPSLNLQMAIECEDHMQAMQTLAPVQLISAWATTKKAEIGCIGMQAAEQAVALSDGLGKASGLEGGCGPCCRCRGCGCIWSADGLAQCPAKQGRCSCSHQESLAKYFLHFNCDAYRRGGICTMMRTFANSSLILC